jgi:hypothetical protein
MELLLVGPCIHSDGEAPRVRRIFSLSAREDNDHGTELSTPRDQRAHQRDPSIATSPQLARCAVSNLLQPTTFALVMLFARMETPGLALKWSRPSWG